MIPTHTHTHVYIYIHMPEHCITLPELCQAKSAGEAAPEAHHQHFFGDIAIVLGGKLPWISGI